LQALINSLLSFLLLQSGLKPSCFYSLCLQADIVEQEIPVTACLHGDIVSPGFALQASALQDIPAAALPAYTGISLAFFCFKLCSFTHERVYKCDMSLFLFRPEFVSSLFALFPVSLIPLSLCFLTLLSLQVT
jgi:hypothetical protein